MNENKKNIEYRNELLIYHRENQVFLNKIIIGISSIAIPVLPNIFFQLTNSSTIIKIFIMISLIGFFITICFQITSIVFATKGCDQGLSSQNNNSEKGWELINDAKKMDIYRNIVFAFSMLFMLMSSLGIIWQSSRENIVTKKNKSEIVNFSITPPRALKSTNGSKKSITPPSSLKPENNSPSSETPPNTPSKNSPKESSSDESSD
ncbi:MAG: hypothetical protein OXB84_03505 [Halobacteriovoraceae bacterium]|nr:hypothetical protein [Halobacteriovoraceae bacterium]